jgi:hypothetical protein
MAGDGWVARISAWRFEVVTKRSQSSGDDWGQTEAIRRHLKQKSRLFTGCFASVRFCYPVDDFAKAPYKSRCLAEREGFEPSLGYYPKHAFQACDLNRSSTSPLLIAAGQAGREF